MAQTIRTFIAIPIPDAVAAAIGRLTARLSAEFSGGRWVETEQLHLTLAFLGDVDQTEVANLCRVAAESVCDIEAFGLRVAGLGAFPTLKQPRVLWAGLTGEALPQLLELHEILIAGLRDAGYRPDDRFSPHITLARFKPGKGAPVDLTDVPGRFARWMAGDLPVHEVITYSSSPGSQGPEYTPLARTTLILADQEEDEEGEADDDF